MIFNLDSWVGAISGIKKSVTKNTSDTALNKQTLGYTKKNLLKLFDNSQTINGIKYTVNVSEGTITIDGKATAYSYSGMGFAVEKKYIKTGTYIFNGCPSGGRTDEVEYYRQTLTLKYADGTTCASFNDYGESITFAVTQEEENKGVYLHYTIYVFPNTTVDDLTFRPMVRLADITDDTFEPYVDDVDTRLKAVTPIERGGTGATTAKEAQYKLLSGMSESTSAVTDSDLMVQMYTSPSSDKGTILYKKMSLLWNYIKGKVETLITNNVNGTVKHEIKMCSGAVERTFTNGSTTFTLPMSFTSGVAIVNILGFSTTIDNSIVNGNELTVEAGKLTGNTCWIKYIVVGY